MSAPSPFGVPEWGIFLVAVPFLCLLSAGLLRLEGSLARAHRKQPAAPAFGKDENGRLFFTDPDGHPWYPARRTK